MSMDKIERLAFLETRHMNETAKRIIKSTLAEILRIKEEKRGDSAFLQDRMKSVKNTLFLKFIGVDYEGIFQPIYIDRKIKAISRS